ncbi:HD domain-containing protein [Armatimonas rosea]|uniref:Bifunctional uridylyltransferase/uridylyl-removing enzyme n=1 Tax=Armatimonas rosea TaxID=685828 RepID=A0A7W9W8T3_ARMRO|nr:[protein-PII] uridylyltransferase [Armatimonas rosea]
MSNSLHTTALASLREERSLTDYLIQARAELRARWLPETGGRAWAQAHSDLLDAVLRRLLSLAAERSGQSPQGIALLATGGYGQRALAPYSDVDLTFLVDRDDDPPLLREAFRLVMDVLMAGARIKVGYAYRHISEIGGDRLDHQTQTALLSARLIAGDGALFARFDRIYGPGLHIADFLFRKISERERIRQKMGTSPYLVEPELKEGAGGLRDIQTALWMARARFDKTGDSLWRELVRRHILTASEKTRLQEAREHLYKIRNLLHLLTDERRDRLSTSRQEEIAARLGITDEGGIPAVEVFMQRHYQRTGDIYHLSEKIMQRCLEAPLALGTDSGLASLRRTVIVAEPRRVAADPHWPLAALEFCQRYELELAPATIEAIEELVDKEGLSTDSGTRFLNLLMQPGDVEQTLRRMHRTGLLRALLPELDACMGLVPYDPAHVWTVGEHTLRVLQNLTRLRPDAPPDSGVPANYREVFASLESPATLYLGALLHDLGKQWPTLLDGTRAPHELTGAERATALCERLGAYPQRAESAVFLVRWHLLLAELSRLRDLTRPETIREVLRHVPDADHLKMLYLLTWADTSAVGPGVWTDMTARLLDELFGRTLGALESDQPDEDDPDEAARRLDGLRGRLRRRLASHATEEESAAIQSHTNAMPAAYLLNTSLETMTLHLAMIGALTSGEAEHGVVADLRTLPGTEQTELTLVAYDDPAPGLLAKITGVLYAYDIRLHAAQVFTRPAEGESGRAIVVDTLVIDHRDQPLDRNMRGELATALGKALGGEEPIPELLARRRRPEPSLGTLQNLRLEPTDGDHTLLDVIVPRGPGAIHALLRTVTAQGWNIHAARLSTWAGLIRCALYLSEATPGAGGDLKAALSGG